jgi:glutamyl-tRNA synthetase
MYRHKKMKTTPETALEALKAALPVLENLDDWTSEGVHTALFDLIAKLEVKNGWLLWPVRTALSGKQFTPGGAVELAVILGKEASIDRIRKGIEKLS